MTRGPGPRDSGFRISLALAGVPAIILTIGGIVLPDTPNSLMDRGYPQDARAILEKVRGTKDVDSEYEDIKQASEVRLPLPFPPPSFFYRLERLCMQCGGFVAREFALFCSRCGGCMLSL